MTKQSLHSEFMLPGIRCAACIAKIEDGLAETPGVRTARINFTARRIFIDHDGQTNPVALRTRIAALGFDAEPIVNVGSEPTIDVPEDRRLLRALGVSGFAAMNVMLLSVAVWSGAEGAVRGMFHWLSALIAMPTVAYAGQPFFRSAWNALRKGRTNMDVPIAIGVLLATAMSLFETIVGGPHAYFDGVVSLLFFLLAGRVLDNAMRKRARGDAAALLRATVSEGTLLNTDGSTIRIRAEAITPSMRLIVGVGERFAADGIIEKGETAIDRSLVTGESAPEHVTPGGNAFAGTLNMDAPVTLRVTAAGRDTAIAEMARLMEAASGAKSRYVRIADRAARYYAPAVHSLAALSFIGWMIAGAGWHQSLLIATAVLIITCPCALGLAVPVAQVVVAGALMRRGILVKDGSALERMAEVDRACFDKTGTLTLGRPELIEPRSIDPDEAALVLALARTSRHPLAQSLMRHFQDAGTHAASVSSVTETPGLGVEAQWQGSIVRLGRPSWIGPENVQGDTMVCALGIGGKAPLLFHFADRLRPDAHDAVNQLSVMGIEAMILSGDRRDAVLPIARNLGLTAMVEMSPAEKLHCVERLKAAGRRVLMVGDGLNDGPALAAGHISIAPSSASDVGQTASDIVFLGDSLMPVPIVGRAARRTMTVVRQNFALAIGYNLLAVPLAVTGLVTPLVAAISMSTSSIIVIANALRLRKAAR